MKLNVPSIYLFIKYSLVMLISNKFKRIMLQLLATPIIKINLTKKSTKIELLVIRSLIVNSILNSQYLQLNGIKNPKSISNYYKNLQMKNIKKPNGIVKILWRQLNRKCFRLL
jgi:hypothetical protein